MDEQARDLERRAGGGDPVAHTRHLADRVRRGELAIERVRLAAFLGDAAAVIFVGDPPDRIGDARPLPVPADVLAIAPCGQEAAVRVALAAFESVASAFRPSRRGGLAERADAVSAARDWLAHPCESHQRAASARAETLYHHTFRARHRTVVQRRENALDAVALCAARAAGASDQRKASGVLAEVEYDVVFASGERFRRTFLRTASYEAAKAAASGIRAAQALVEEFRRSAADAVAASVRDAVVPWLLGVPAALVVPAPPPKRVSAPLLASPPTPRRARTARERHEVEHHFLERLSLALAERGFELTRARNEFRRLGAESEERLSVVFTYGKFRIPGGTSPRVDLDLETRFPELEPVVAYQLQRDGVRPTHPGCRSGRLSTDAHIGTTRGQVEASFQGVLRGVVRELAWFDDHASLEGLERDHRRRPLPPRPYVVDDRQVLAALYAVRGRREAVVSLLPLLHEGARLWLATVFPALDLPVSEPTRRAWLAQRIVRVRARPDPGAPVLGDVQPQRTCVSTGASADGRWLAISYRGQGAWIWRDLLTPVHVRCVLITAAAARFRDAPDGHVVGEGHAGEFYTFRGLLGEWVEVDWGDLAYPVLPATSVTIE